MEQHGTLCEVVTSCRVI